MTDPPPPRRPLPPPERCTVRVCRLPEVGRPDDLPGDPHPVGDLEDRRALGRSLNLQAVETRPFLRRVAHRRAEQPVVDEAADSGHRTPAAIWTNAEAPAVSTEAAAVRGRTAMGLAFPGKDVYIGTQYKELRHG